MSRTTLISALLGAALLAACKPEPEPKKSNGGDGEASVFEQFCNQLDECNSTMLEGMSATECADYFVDCTDDPALAHPLALLSNGLSLPLVRLAVDGSGQRELGRVSVSHGGGGHACQLCSYPPAAGRVRRGLSLGTASLRRLTGRRRGS